VSIFAGLNKPLFCFLFNNYNKQLLKNPWYLVIVTGYKIIDLINEKAMRLIFNDRRIYHFTFTFTVFAIYSNECFN